MRLASALDACRPRLLPAMMAAFVVLLVACGSQKAPSPEPRVIVSVPSATPTRAPVQPPTGGAPSFTGTVPGPPPTATATVCPAGVDGCATPPVGAPATAAAASPSASAAVVPSVSTTALSAAPSDNSLQAALARALVREGDLPSGYTASYLGQTDATLPHQTSGYGGFFANGDPTNPGPGGFQVFIAALAGFTDPASAQAQAADVRSSSVSSLGQGVTMQPLPTQVGIEGAQLYQVQAPNNAGGQLTGFVVAWQHGRVLAVLAQLGVPPPSTPDIINAIARRQDQKLTAAGL